MQKDPHPGALGVPIAVVNSYAYAANNPFNIADPTGQSFLGAVVGVLLIVIAVVVAAVTVVAIAAIASAVVGGAAGSAGGPAGVAVGALIGFGVGLYGASGTIDKCKAVEVIPDNVG